MSNVYLTSDFFENEDHALRKQPIVLRDSLGNLAIQILCSKNDISTMKYDDILLELYEIISELHKSYMHLLEHTGFD